MPSIRKNLAKLPDYKAAVKYSTESVNGLTTVTQKLAFNGRQVTLNLKYDYENVDESDIDRDVKEAFRKLFPLAVIYELGVVSSEINLNKNSEVFVRDKKSRTLKSEGSLIAEDSGYVFKASRDTTLDRAKVNEINKLFKQKIPPNFSSPEITNYPALVSPTKTASFCQLKSDQAAEPSQVNVFDLYREVSKLDPSKYQNLNVNQKSGEVTVLNPWYGKIFYFFGLKTKVSEQFLKLLESKLKQTENEFKIRAGQISSGSEVEETFKLIGAVDKVNTLLAKFKKNRELLRINRIENRIKKFLLSQGEMPSIREIASFINFNGTPLTESEKIAMRFYYSRLPAHNKARVAYELIENKTRNLDLSQLPNKAYTIGEETVSFYDVTGSDYKYLLHAAALATAASLLHSFDEKKLNASSLCTSLVTPETRFFSDTSRVALVLAVDPYNIISTMRRDIQTPNYNPVTNDLELKKMTDDFYNFYEKMNLITEYVNQVYIFSGLDKSPLLNDFQKKLRLDVLKQDLLGKRTATWSEREEALYKEVCDELDNLVEKLGADNIRRDFTQFQLEHLISHYKNNPSLDNQEEFRKIFRFDGKGIVDELIYCRDFVQGLKDNDRIQVGEKSYEYLYRRNFNKIVAPNELLSETYTILAEDTFGDTQYNEINIRLDNKKDRNTRPAAVSAILINKYLLEHLPASEKDKFLALASYAKKHNIPLLLRD